VATAARGRSVVASTAFLFVARILVSGISYAATALIARTLTPRDWGAYTFVISATTILDALFDLRVTRLVLRDLTSPDSDAGHVMGSFLVLRLLLGGASYVAALAFVAANSYPPIVLPAMAIGGMTLVFAAGWNALNLYYQSKLWLRSVAIALVGARVVFVAVCVALASSGSTSVKGYLAASVVNEAIPFVVLALLARRHVQVRPAVERAQWWRWLKDGFPIAIGWAIGTIYFRVDSIMLASLGSFTDVGLYGIGYKFADIIDYLYAALTAPVVTMLIRDWPDRLDMFRRTFRGAFVLLTISGVGLATGFAVFARPAVVTVFGDRYDEAAGAARLVVAGQGLRFFSGLCVITLIAVRRNREYVLAALTGLVINVAVNFAVIPRYSYVGAAWVTVVTELGVLIVLVRAVASIDELPQLPFGLLFRTALAGAVLAAVGLGVDSFAPWEVAAVIAALAYLLVLHVLGVDGPGGLRVVPQLLGRTDEVGPDFAGPR